MRHQRRFNSSIGKFCRLLEYLHKHFPRQLTRPRVLVRGMVGGQQDLSVRQLVLRAMSENVGLLCEWIAPRLAAFRRRWMLTAQPAKALHVIQICVESNLP